MNLADPELELIDPTPNIQGLFVHFDKIFFDGKLIGRVLIRWSKKMYSCAGACRYEGKHGICDIALSEPLLKLRTRKDLIETLLHEMIHAFLFITSKDKNSYGHGPKFLVHMFRINEQAGLRITIYHDFHDEVRLYMKHVWRCNGICRYLKPNFGFIRRFYNRIPGPSDPWWETHRRVCDGIFIKVNEPVGILDNTDAYDKIKTNYNFPIIDNTMNKFLIKGNNNKNMMANVVKNIPNNKISPVTPPSNAGNPLKIIDNKKRNSGSVIETVRAVWSKSQIPTNSTSKPPAEPVEPTDAPNTNKHKLATIHTESPLSKIKKVDGNFTSTASSILKDLYGKEFTISQSSNNKLTAVTVEDNDSTQREQVNATEVLVDCPSCTAKVKSKDINKHLDECLNKEIIHSLKKEFIQILEDTRKLQDIIGVKPEVPPFKSKAKTKTVKTDKVPKTEKKHTNPSNITEPGNSRDNYQVQMCPCCGNEVHVSMEIHLGECLGFFNNNVTIPKEATSFTETIIIEDENPSNPSNIKIKVEPGTTKGDQIVDQKCPCCGETVTKPIEFHLEECLGFLHNGNTVPVEGANVTETIVIDDDDTFDETKTLNVTGTKTPCPCCLKMVEIDEMNEHLNHCIFKSVD